MTQNPEQIMAEFARTRVRAYPGLGREDGFPRDLWTEMGDLGLLDPETFSPKRTGLPGGRCRVLVRTARALVREGGNLGLSLSWMIHHLTAHYIWGAENSQSREPGRELTRDLKTGAATLSFAVSEPGVGSHPKAISTRAQRDGEGWVIWGEKSYLTNGPIARAFVVIAVTGQTGECQGKKEFSAFLVNRDTPGLTLLPAMEIPFFKPSPHGGIRMDSCRVGPEALVGTVGRAYPDLVLRFRQLEDALVTGAVTGAMAFLVQALARQIQGRPIQGRQDPALYESLGRLAAMADAAGDLSDQVAGAVDSGLENREGSHLFFRDLASGFIESFDACLSESGVDLPLSGQIVLRDLKASAELGKNISRLRLRKLGQTLIRSGK